MDFMIKLYIIGLFTLILVCIYALIQSKANRWYTFTIIPFALAMSLYTWQAITALQGLPIHGLPFTKDVIVLYIYDQKPWIYVVLNTKNGPMLYKVEWSKENQEKMQKLKGSVGTSEAEGKFTKALNGDSSSFEFSNIGENGGNIIKPSEPKRITR